MKNQKSAAATGAASPESSILPPVAPTTITPWQGKPQEFPLNFEVRYGSEIIPLNEAERTQLNRAGEGLQNWSVGAEVSRIIREHYRPDKKHVQEAMEWEGEFRAVELLKAAAAKTGKGWEAIVSECVMAHLGDVFPIKNALAGKGGK